MPTFTMRLADAIERSGATTEYVNGQTVLLDSNIGLEHYPIFSEPYRRRLNSLIVDEYWNHEIAHETIAIFKQRLSQHMFLHMPTFNKRYELALLDFDPLITTKLTNTGTSLSKQTGSSDETGEQSGSSTATSVGDANTKAGTRAVQSDTPGTMLRGNADYATSANDVTNYQDSESTSADEGTTLGSSTSNVASAAESEAESEATTVGYTGSAADLIERAQATLLNIDLMVVESLQHLFFQLWANSDEMETARGGYYGY